MTSLAHFLSSIGLGAYTDRFEKLGVTLEELPKLTPQQLNAEFGIGLSDRKSLLAALEQATRAPRAVPHDPAPAPAEGVPSVWGAEPGAWLPASAQPTAPTRTSEPRAPLSLLAPGDSLGGFRVTGALGRGSYGQVYEAITEYGDEQMAIKVLPLYGETRDAARAFVKGWAAVRDIRHPNLLRSERPQPATVRGLDVLIFPLELASGGSFRAWLDDTRVSRLDAQAWANAVVDGLAALAHLAHGLAALHAAGRVHLDVKPENLLRVGDTWKVSDCGFARDIDAARRAGGAGLAEWVGVPTYRSPEQFLAARPQDVGPEADVWSLGVMLFELLDGHPPVQGDDARVRELVSNPNLRIVWETIPAEWQPLAQRCLAHSPALRPTAMEVAAALARFSPEEGRPPAAHSAPPTPAGAPASAGPAPRPVASALERDATPDMARRGTPAPEPLTSGSAGELTLRHGSRRLGPFQIAQVIGESVTRPLGAEHRFFAPDQFRLEPAGGQWFIVPSPEAPNETLLDGRAISERTPLVQGAEVSVGREAKGIRKLPMIVDIT